MLTFDCCILVPLLFIFPNVSKLPVFTFGNDSDSYTSFLTAKGHSSGANVLKQSDSFTDVNKYLT